MTAFKNGAGAEAMRMVEFRPYADAEDVGKGELYTGKPGQRSTIWTSDTEFTTRIHDGFTPGGHIIDGGGGPGEGIEVQVQDTQTARMVRAVSGNTRTLSTNVRVSNAADNQLEIRSGAGNGGGLFVPAPAVTTVDAADASVEVDEVTAGNYEVGVQISEAPGNLLTLEADGLNVSPQIIPPAVTVAGSNTGVTVAEPTTGNYTVGARRSPDANNQLEIRGNGLYVPPGEGGGGEFPALDPGVLSFDIEANGGSISFTDGSRRSYLAAPAVTTYMRFSGWNVAAPAENYLWVEGHGQPWQFQFTSGISVNGVTSGGSIDVPQGGGLKVFKTAADTYTTLPYFPEGAGGGGGGSYTAGDGLELDGSEFSIDLLEANGQKLRTDGGSLYLQNLQMNIITAPAYTLQGTRANEVVQFTHTGSTVGLTVPADANITQYPYGCATLLVHPEADFRVAPEAGVRINGQLSTSWMVKAQPGGAVLIRTSSNTWMLLGDVEVDV